MLEAGSMPVRFDLQSNTKVARDRYLTLRLQTDDANVVPPSNGMQYDLTINLREGQNAYKKTYLLPKWFAGQALTATLLEDNLPLEGYEISFQVPISSRTPLISIGSSLGVLAQEIVCNWLYVDDETNGENQVPDLLSNFISIRDRQGFTNKDFQSYQELFSKRYPEHFPTNSIPSVQSWTTLQKGSGLERISTTQLVEDWRFYQRYDVILIHARNYRQLQLKQDPRYLAIRQWQLLGGTLVVVADQINLETEVSNKTKGLLDRIAEEELAEIIDEMESQLAGINLKHPVSRIFALPDPSGPDRLNYVVPAERESSTQSAAASILYEELTTGLTSSEIERFRLTSSIYHHLQTFGTFLNTLIFGINVGSDEFGNKYYRNKSDTRRWVIYKDVIDASKIPPEWHSWIHKIIKSTPDKIKFSNYEWQKKYTANLTGTTRSYNPNLKNKNFKKKKYKSWQPD